jgi:hypothetical protein
MKNTAIDALLCAVALLTLASQRVSAKDLVVTITSLPSGAKVEIDGVEKGYTPYSMRVPPGFVKATHSVFSKKLVSPAVLRLSKPGYATKEMQLTAGPLKWKNVYGITMMDYYLLKSTSFHFELEPTAQLNESQSASPPTQPQTSTGQIETPSPNDMAPSAAVTPTQGAEFGSVDFVCEPGGAEIYVDGKFVGSAPASLKLEVGSHAVQVKNNGYRVWDHMLQVMKDSQVTIRAKLDPQ